MREDERAERDVRLYRSGSSDADYVERTLLRLRLTGREVNIDKSVKLVHNDVDIVRSDTCGKHGYPYALVFSRYGYKFTGLVAELLLFEILPYHVNPAGITDQYHILRKLLRPEMKMEY